MKKWKAFALLLVVPILLTSCGDIFDLGILTDKTIAAKYQEYFEGITPMRGDIKVQTPDLSQLDLAYSERELSAEYDSGSATRIVFSDGGSTVYGKGAESDGKDVTVSASGIYIISGSASGALLTVDATYEDDVHLVLSDLSLEGKSGTALDIRSVGSILLTLTGESTLSDSLEYKPSALNKQTGAVILCQKDLAINGSGSLSVVGYRAHGILSRGALTVTGGNIKIQSSEAAFIGEKCVKIGGGALNIRAEEEGILSGRVLEEEKPSEETEESVQRSGYIYVSGGSLQISSTGDAIHAESLLVIEDGEFELSTGVRMDEILQEQEEEETLPKFWDIFEPSPKEMAAEETEKAVTVFSDGLYAASDILIRGGVLAIDASGRGVFAGEALCIDGGKFKIRAIGNGLCAEGAVGISDGILILETSKIGISGASVDISGAHIYMAETECGVFTRGKLLMSGGVLAVAGATGLPLDFGAAMIEGGVLVALGNGAVAREFFPGRQQGVVLCRFEKQKSGYPLALLDNEGALLLSLEGRREYSLAYFSAPEIKQGRAYTLASGGFAPGSDRYGLAIGGESMIASTSLAVVTANS
ncbi:MAG: carbohydrate-binding domain-containing protein [Ruminococcaceae bacterium]|nr:carbohydrate-binding domain-containing protein [Oscillospiraceae bacterium]